jgi:tetratricopeptide (TPR) repeat protein
MTKRLTLLPLLLLLLAGLAAAQMFFGTFRGKATAADGTPIVGATIRIVEKDTGRKYEVKTDKDGEYSISSISSGTYSVSLVVKGEVLRTSGNQKPDPNRPTDINFDMRVQGDSSSVSAEQKKKLEEMQKQNADVMKENEKRRAANLLLEKADAALQESPPNTTQAVAYAQQVTEMVPDVYVGWARLGEMASLDKKHELAVQANQKAIALLEAEPDPTGKNKNMLAGLHNNLGQAFARSGKAKEALTEYTAAAQIDPPSAALYYFNAGAVLTNTYHPDEANQAFDKAIAADPNYAEAYYQKGLNLLQKGTFDKSGKTHYPPEAGQALQKYLELAPSGKNAESAKAVLADMGQDVQTSYKKKK